MANIIVFHTAWMAQYDGDRGSLSAGGFKFAAEHGYGHEMYNFRNIGGRYYGYVPPTGTLHFENHFAVPRRTDVLEGVTVVWTAPHPEQGGRAVVGIWRDATVYRNDQESHGKLVHRRKIGKEIAGYRCVAETKNCILLQPDARPIFVSQGQSRGGESWPGQQKVFYPKPKSQALMRLNEILRAIDVRRLSAVNAQAQRGNKGRSGWQADVEKRRQVEVAAVKAVGLHLEGLGYTVESVENDNLGYDLVASHADEILHVEVKGRSGNEVAAELSVNEFNCLRHYHGERNPKAHYRIAIVTDALVRPLIREFVLVRGRTLADSSWWTLDGHLQLQFEERKAARLTAIPGIR
ncbi:MAG TPA: DUF3883 domain-containing protein [Rhizomicrobium sp.]|nr:DUF3883 domain-containing protein [Rhizomicrobium sp.]